MFLTPVATKATATGSGPAAAAGSAAASAAGSSASASAGASADGAARSFNDILASLRTDAGTRPEATAGKDENEDRFLKLLVAQMNNQDPLNPLDNAQVTSQLAQINTVQGIENLNTKLQAMLDRGQGGGLAEATPLLGRDVLLDGNAIRLPEEGVARGGFSLPESASSVRIEMLDRSGAVVDTRLRSHLAAGVHTFEWDGRAGASSLDPGAYTFRVTAAAGDRKVEATALSAQPVRAVFPGTDGALLQVGSGAPRPMSDIRAVL